MSDYLLLETDRGAFALSPRLIERIVFEEAYFRSKYQNARKVEEDLGMLAPTITSYDFDFAKAKSAGQTAADTLFSRVPWLSSSLLVSGDDVLKLRGTLTEMERRARDYKQSCVQLMKDASAQSMKSINSTTAWLEAGLETTKFVRDASADIFIIAGTAVTGGSALALLGIGATAKGAFKYQDTENLGAATIEATTGFIAGLMKFGGKGATSQAEKVAFIVMQKSAESLGTFGTSLVEGKTVWESAQAAAVELGAGFLGDKLAKRIELDQLSAFNDLVAKKSLLASCKLTIPVTGRDIIGLVGESSISLITKGAVKGAVNLGVNLKNDLEKKRSANPAGLVLALPIGDPVLAELAIMGPDRCTPVRTW